MTGKKTKINIPGRFVVVDFETMEGWRASVCEVGVAVIEDGRITDTYKARICPPSANENPYCTAVHGIHYKDVKDCPKFDEVWKHIDETYIKESPLLAHNASFERSCIKECGDFYGTNTDYTYYDTLRLARKYMAGMDCYKLNVLARAIRYRFKHHDAGDDAKACATLFLHLCKKNKGLLEECKQDGTERDTRETE